MARSASSQKSRILLSRMLSATALTAAGMMMFSASAEAGDNAWTQFEDVHGSITIDAQTPGQTNIDQHTQTYIGNSNNLDILKGQTVTIGQNNTGSLFVGRSTRKGADPTRILGNLNTRLKDANGNFTDAVGGKVMVLDRNGVIFGRDARIDVGGIIASTGDISNQDIINGDGQYEFSNFGPGSIDIQGSITVSDAGLAAFVSPTISNSGVINAKMGTVVMASGEKVTLDLYGDELVEIAVSDELSHALIENTGTINAQGGTVVVKAEAAKDIVDNVINMGGVVNASSAEVKGGKIVLGGGANGSVKVTGTLDASGKNGGGDIKVTGKNVRVTETANVVADAKETGNGGRVDLIADESMVFNGQLSARGGDISGNGGSAEISGYGTLGFDGLVDLGADNGTRGSLLLDPTFAVIHSGALPGGWLQDYVISAGKLALSLRNADITVQADNYIDVGTKQGGYTNENWTNNAFVDAIITAGLNNLADGDIDLSTWNFFGANGTTNGSLTLQSNTVNFNRDLTMGNGNLIVDGGNGGINWLADVTMNGGGDIDASTGGAQTFTNSVLTTTGDVTLSAGGNIRQTDAAVSGIRADRFSAVSANGGIDLQGQNNFAALDDVTAKNAVTIIDRTGGISVDGNVSGSGVSISSHNGDMQVNGTVTAVNALGLWVQSGKALFLNDGSALSGKSVALNVEGGAQQHANSVITANTLTGGTGKAGANIHLDGANQIAQLGNITVNRGNFSLNNGRDLSIAGLINTKSASVSGVGGNVTIDTAGNLTVANTGSVNAQGGSITLTQDGIFSSGANTLKTGGAGAINVEQRNGGSINQAVNAFDNSGTGTNTALVHDGVYDENVTINDSNVTLISENGRDATIINGSSGTAAQGTVYLVSGLRNVQVGDVDQGFTINGFDGELASQEKGALYLQGNQNNIRIIGNEIVAKGEGGLLTEWGGVLDNIVIDSNIFSGKTFHGTVAGGQGFDGQFDVDNTPRALLYISGNAGGSTKTNITVTNNEFSGTAGGLNAGGNNQGNSLVTVDAYGADIKDNIFNGVTTDGYALRTRGQNTNVSGNDFYASGLSGNAGYFLAGAGSLGTPSTIPGVFANNDFFGNTVHATAYTGDQIIHRMIQPVVNAAATSATVHVSAGTFNEGNINLPRSLIIRGDTQNTTIVDAAGYDNGFMITGNLGSRNATVSYMTIQNATKDGVFVSDAATLKTLNLVRTTLKNNGHHGVAVYGNGIKGLSVQNAHFLDNGWGGGSKGEGDILAYDHNGDVFLKNVTIENNSPAGLADYGVQIRGNDSFGAGKVTLENVSIAGSYRAAQLGIQRFGDLTLSMSDVKLGGQTTAGTNSSGWGALYLSELGSNNLALGNTAFGAHNGQYITLGFGAGYNTTNNIDATNATFEGVKGSTATRDQNFAIEDKIYHKLDNAGQGLVTWHAGNVYVTQASGSIQRGVDASNAGGNVWVDDGTFNEAVNVHKSVTITGTGTDNTTIVDGTGLGANKDGFLISANDVSLNGMIVQNFSRAGINIAGTRTNLSLDDIAASGNNIGFRMGTTESLDGFTVTDSHFDNNNQGWFVAKSMNAGDASVLNDVTVSGTTFSNNKHKGLYAEKLSNATFTDIDVINSGTDTTYGSHNAGIDINLKNGAYSNITFDNVTISGSGVNAYDAAQGRNESGQALAVKARNDAPSYNALPASLTGLTIKNSDITAAGDVGVTIGYNVSDIAVTDNTNITGPYALTFFGGANDITVSGNTLTSAGIDGGGFYEADLVGAGYPAGLLFLAASDATVTDNTITGGVMGIYGKNSNNLTIGGSAAVDANTIHGTDYGIFLQGGTSTDSRIEGNTIHDIAQQAIHIRENQYADIIGNTIYDTNVGITTENFYQAAADSARALIDGNTVSARLIGIRNNLSYGTQSGFTISNNTITAEDPANTRRWTGIDVVSQQGGVGTLFQGNMIDGSGAGSRQSAGYELTNMTNANRAVIDGGTVDKVDVGVWVTDGSFYTGAVSDLLIKNVAFGDIAEAGILVEDTEDPNNVVVPNFNVNTTGTKVTIGSGNSFTNTPYDLAIAGDNVTVALDAGFDGVSKTLVKAAGAAHYVGNPNGTTTNLTTNNASIQTGVNATGTGGQVDIEAGTFNEGDIKIGKAMLISGAGKNSTIVNAAGFNNGYLIDDNLGNRNTTLRRMTVQNATQAGVRVSETGALKVLTLNQMALKNNGHNGLAVYGNGLKDLRVLNSDFRNNGWTGGGSGEGDILAFQYNGDVTLTNVTIENDAPAGTADYSIQLRGKDTLAASGTVKLDNVRVAGSYRAAQLGIQRYDGLTVSMNDVVLGGNTTAGTASSGWGALYLSELGNNPLALGNTSFLSHAGQYITLGYGAGYNTRNNIDATGVSFEGITGATATLDQHFAIEDKVFHKLDNAGQGLVVWNPGNVYVTQASGSIQRGVDASDVGGNVWVDQGTFQEQVSIGKNLTLTGSGIGQTVVQSPANLAQTNTSPNGSRNYGIIHAHDADNIKISGLTVDGSTNAQSPVFNDQNRFIGVIYENAGGTLENTHITNIKSNPSSGRTGFGVLAFDDTGAVSNLVIRGNTIDNFQKYGIALANAKLNATVTGNTITGDQANIAAVQSGVFVTSGAKAVIGGAGAGEANTITNADIGIELADAGNTQIIANSITNAASHGILASGTGNKSIVVAGNTLSNNKTGAEFQSGTIDLSGATNTINGGDVGLRFDPKSTANASKLLLAGVTPDYKGGTIGSTVFAGLTDPTDQFIVLANGAFFDPGQPSLIDARFARFNGLSASDDATGRFRLYQAQLDTIENRVFHFKDAATLGQIFYGNLNSVPVIIDITSNQGIDQEDTLQYFSPVTFQSSALNIMINGLPNISGMPQALNNITPFAGGSSDPAALNDMTPAAGDEADPADLNDIESASGSAEASCWADATGMAQGGQVVNISYGASAEDMLNSAAACSVGI